MSISKMKYVLDILCALVLSGNGFTPFSLIGVSARGYSGARFSNSATLIQILSLISYNLAKFGPNGRCLIFSLGLEITLLGRCSLSSDCLVCSCRPKVSWKSENYRDKKLGFSTSHLVVH